MNEWLWWLIAPWLGISIGACIVWCSMRGKLTQMQRDHEHLRDFTARLTQITARAVELGMTPAQPDKEDIAEIQTLQAELPVARVVRRAKN